jgi:uncharacterized protein with HEPN domain
MSLEIKKLLQDIYDSIVLIEGHLEGINNLEAYTSDIKTVDAVERRIAIIGEALWKANKINPEINISDKTKIISLRHIVIHDYDLVEDATIWVVCKKHLPVLKAEIQSILNS